MKRIALILALFSTAAIAQERGAPQKPCSRGPVQMRISGVDMDELQCRLYTLNQELGQQVVTMAALQAHTAIVENDLEDADATQDELQDSQEQ